MYTGQIIWRGLTSRAKNLSQISQSVVTTEPDETTGQLEHAQIVLTLQAVVAEGGGRTKTSGASWNSGRNVLVAMGTSILATSSPSSRNSGDSFSFLLLLAGSRIHLGHI
jgi:hypothetical protein